MKSNHLGIGIQTTIEFHGGQLPSPNIVLSVGNATLAIHPMIPLSPTLSLPVMAMYHEVSVDEAVRNLSREIPPRFLSITEEIGRG